MSMRKFYEASITVKFGGEFGGSTSIKQVYDPYGYTEFSTIEKAKLALEAAKNYAEANGDHVKAVRIFEVTRSVNKIEEVKK